MKHATLRTLGIVLAAACAKGGDAPAPAAAEPRVVSLSTKDLVFQAPDTIDAGWTVLRFANHGDDVHYAHMVRLDPGKTVPEMVAAYAEAIRTSGPRPSWVHRFGGPGGTAPGDSSAVTQRLEPGDYVWVCPIEDSAGTPHFSKGEFRPFVVRPAEDRAAAPVPTATIRLVDYGFAPDSLRAARHTLRVVNQGQQPHDLVLMQLAPGVTMEQVRLLLNPERARRDAPAGDPGQLMSMIIPIGGVAAIGPGMEAFFETTLAPGDYVLACMATAPDGKSHIEHGMMLQILVQ